MLSPSDALRTFSLPPGYRVELVASEPLIQDPIRMEWDAAGRLWAIELPSYMRDIRGSGELDPTGRIVVLEDTDRDGRMDRRTVFADGLIQPRALTVLDRGVLVGEPPDIWLMQDTDGDLRADRKELVATGFGRRELNVEVNANSLYWGLDNNIYVSGTDADLFLRLVDGTFVSSPSLSRGQWGVTQDDWGRLYRNHNESVLHADLVPTPYYARNPHLLRTRGSHEALTSPAANVNAVWPARPTPGTNRAYQLGILRSDGTLATYTAACAPTVYRGDRLPADLSGNVIVAEPTANLVSRIVVTDDGTTLRASKAYAGAEFLTSTDERFRPVYLSNAPDGTLYVVDMYRGIIQQGAYMTEYLRDQIQSRGLEQPTGLGRIYRVSHDTTVRDTGTTLAGASPARLVEALSHPNGWWRDAAQRMLVERRDLSVLPALARLAGVAPDPRTRLHALWTLDGLGAIEPATVIRALDDDSRDVRVSAVRLAERWAATGSADIKAALLQRMSDPDWAVRQQLAASLGALPPGFREEAVGAMLERFGDDPIVVDAALSGVAGSEAIVLEHLLQADGGPTPQRAPAVVMLAATVVRAGENQAVQDTFTWAADERRPAWQRSLLLQGAEVALLGAEMPGPAVPGRAALPTPACPTCTGARGGPGGAYAFPEGRGSAAVIPREPARRLRLSQEPSALSALAGADGPLAPRATALLARVDWPGKAGVTIVAPLTAEEQVQFEAGQEIYRNRCVGCHQPDGRGQDKLAPSLVGSRLALAAPEIGARILLDGKEGPVGLMPPVGSVLSDEQVAAVLTYVRREWGQDGAPVPAAVVTATRAVTAGRSRPWTNEELLALAGTSR